GLDYLDHVAGGVELGAPRRRDADQPAVVADHRPARVAVADRRVGLDEVLAGCAVDAAPALDLALAQRQAAAADVGIAQHPDPLAHLDVGGARLRQGRPGLAGAPPIPGAPVEIEGALDQREIELALQLAAARLAGAVQLRRLVLLAEPADHERVVQPAVAIVDDVVVGEDRAVLADDHARAAAARAEPAIDDVGD